MKAVKVAVAGLVLCGAASSGCIGEVGSAPTDGAPYDDEEELADEDVELGSTVQAQVFSRRWDCASVRSVLRNFNKIETRNHRMPPDNAMSPADLAWADNAPVFSAHEQAMAHYMINGSRPGKTLFNVVNGSTRPVGAGELLFFLASHCL
jgi:hypothetical protein